jgi:hypothetical protein
VDVGDDVIVGRGTAVEDGSAGVVIVGWREGGRAVSVTGMSAAAGVQAVMASRKNVMI